MENQPVEPIEILPPSPIRVETALSRYPVHRLAKHGDIAINIHERNASGELSIRWEVRHSPGPLAYKLDTLIINRRIEEAPRPIPKIIRLGSLRDICRELGETEGENINTIRNALRQNAFAGITAKIHYRLNNGGEETLDTDFTRYSVVFTGQKLPDGRKADAVYIILNDVYMQVLNGAMTRPLDYDYLKSLPPAPQRFYELLSYQMYATLKNDRPRAKMLYSEFCTYAPQTRYPEFDQLKKQMFKIHRRHRQSGYIGKIDYHQTTDPSGQPDWEMLYQPGPKARAEYRAFTKRGGPVTLQAEPLRLEATPQPVQPLLIEQEPPSPLAAELVAFGITEHSAAELVREHAGEKIRLQIEILDWRLSGKRADKIDDPAAWLVSAIKSPKGHAVPKGFVSKAERHAREEAKQAKEREKAQAKRREREESDREQKEKQAINAYWASLTPKEQAELEAAAVAQADAEQRKLIEPGPMKKFGLVIIRDGYIRRLLAEAIEPA